MRPPTLHLGLLRLAPDPPGPLTLTPEEEARLRRITAPLRAAQYQAGRQLLRRLAALAAGVGPEAVSLNAEGRPQARLATGAPAPFLSLAHSGDWVLGAAGSVPCGVDIERLGARHHWKDLARYLGLPEGVGETGVLRHWTLKEARFKAGDPERPLVRRFETPDYFACLATPLEVEAVCWKGGVALG